MCDAWHAEVPGAMPPAWDSQAALGSGESGPLSTHVWDTAGTPPSWRWSMMAGGGMGLSGAPAARRTRCVTVAEAAAAAAAMSKSTRLSVMLLP